MGEDRLQVGGDTTEAGDVASKGDRDDGRLTAGRCGHVQHIEECDLGGEEPRMERSAAQVHEVVKNNCYAGASAKAPTVAIGSKGSLHKLNIVVARGGVEGHPLRRSTTRTLWMSCALGRGRRRATPRAGAPWHLPVPWCRPVQRCAVCKMMDNIRLAREREGECRGRCVWASWSEGHAWPV
jgi:hypothetical protein